MEQYRSKRTIQVFMQVTEKNIRKAWKICNQLYQGNFDGHDLRIINNSGEFLNDFGCYLIKNEAGDWALISPEFLNDYEPISAPSVPDYINDRTVEEIWEQFWKGVVCNPDGTVNIDQVKKELADFSFVLDQFPKVYCYVTGDRMSKAFYKAEDVIRVADDYQKELFEEWKKDETEDGRQIAGVQWVKEFAEHIGQNYRYRHSDNEWVFDSEDQKNIQCETDVIVADYLKENPLPVSLSTAAKEQETAIAFVNWIAFRHTPHDFDTWDGGAKNTHELYDDFQHDLFLQSQTK